MSAIQTLLASLRQDLRIARRQTILNTLAGSFLVPRVLRVLLYRIMGIRALRANVSAKVIFTGTDVVLGERTFVNSGCYFDVGGTGSLRVGESCNFGPGVTITCQTHDRVGNAGYDRAPRGTAVVIGDDVWIGATATVLPGVTIGDGVVVAAGAVVTRDLPSGGVYGGVPAKVILSRAHDQLASNNVSSEPSENVIDLTDGALGLPPSSPVDSPPMPDPRP